MQTYSCKCGAIYKIYYVLPTYIGSFAIYIDYIILYVVCHAKMLLNGFDNILAGDEIYSYFSNLSCLLNFDLDND